MKTLIQIFIAAMFAIEICSPFFIGYLNQKAKQQKIQSETEVKNIASNAEIIKPEIKQIKNWKLVDFSENNYSDSKTLIVKE
ncbi:MAG TPA: hypothetical protein VN026_15465 [Bacteroidia bacterium]|jgi:hypothetical protein|nr:hypothetical protein [Bacteroidia bacterium]